MNAKRRKEIGDVVSRLQAIYSELEELAGQEREAYENLPESLQYSEKGEQMDESASDLETAQDDIQAVIDSLEDIINR